MKRKNNFTPGKMNWDEFQNIFKDKNFMGNHFLGSNTNDPQWIEEYIQNILAQSMPNMNQRGGPNPQTRGSQSPPSANHPNSPLQSEIFEGHYTIIIKVLIPHQVNPNQLRIFHAANQLRVDGIPNQTPEIIELPMIGRTDGAIAVIKNNILEVTIPKESNIRFHEIPIVFE